MTPRRAFATTLSLTLGLLVSSHGALRYLPEAEPVDVSAQPELNTLLFTVEDGRESPEAPDVLVAEGVLGPAT
jgi:hypothetical protein